jgi:hypothetical protein
LKIVAFSQKKEQSVADCYHQHLNIAFFNTPLCIFPNSSSGERDDLQIHFIRGVVWSKIYGIPITLHQIRKNLIEQSNPQNWLKLTYYLAGSFYYWLNKRRLFQETERVRRV